jgi:hypothetical protein
VQGVRMRANGDRSRSRVLAGIIPAERPLRQPFVDGRERLLALGPFVTRLPIERELRIGFRISGANGGNVVACAPPLPTVSAMYCLPLTM